MEVLEKNSLTAEIFTELREAADFSKIENEDIMLALDKTLFSVVAYEGDKPVGMGRVIGDDRIAFFIKDVVVHPDYQGKKIGSKVMKSLLSYIDTKGCDGAYIGLMSTPNKEHFYKRFGFIERPTKGFGSGMVQFLSK